MMRRTPIRRTGFKRKAARGLNPFSGNALHHGATFKRKAPKKREGHDKRMLSACRGERCYLRVPGVCLPSADTVVPCHSNEQRHGKGMGIKARDEFTVPGCQACHAWLDQGATEREVKFGVWRSAYGEWVPVRAVKLGLPPVTDESCRPCRHWRRTFGMDHCAIEQAHAGAANMRRCEHFE